MKKTTVGYHVRYEFKGVRDTYCHVKMTNKYVSKVCLTHYSVKDFCEKVFSYSLNKEEFRNFFFLITKNKISLI